MIITEEMFKIPADKGTMVSSSLGDLLEKYELATHTVKVRRTGMMSDVTAIWDLPGDAVDTRRQSALIAVQTRNVICCEFPGDALIVIVETLLFVVYGIWICY